MNELKKKNTDAKNCVNRKKNVIDAKNVSQKVEIHQVRKMRNLWMVMYNFFLCNLVIM